MDNFAADREAAERAIRINPDIVPTARAAARCSDKAWMTWP